MRRNGAVSFHLAAPVAAEKIGRSCQNRQGKSLIVKEWVFEIFIFVPKCVLETEPTADTARGKPETKGFTEPHEGSEGHQEANRGLSEIRGREVRSGPSRAIDCPVARCSTFKEQELAFTY